MSDEVAPTGEATADGRARRSERSRAALVEALLALIDEGQLRPTAQQVADRAGVGIRTVFRHFSDMETLYAAMNARVRAEVEPSLAAGPPDAKLEQRARALVAHRCGLYERIRNYRRADETVRWSSPTLQANYDRFVRDQRHELLRWLPELAEADGEGIDALEAATSIELWERLRGPQKLSARRTRATIERAVLALLRDVVQPG